MNLSSNNIVEFSQCSQDCGYRQASVSRQKLVALKFMEGRFIIDVSPLAVKTVGLVSNLYHIYPSIHSPCTCEGGAQEHEGSLKKQTSNFASCTCWLLSFFLLVHVHAINDQLKTNTQTCSQLVLGKNQTEKLLHLGVQREGAPANRILLKHISSTIPFSQNPFNSAVLWIPDLQSALIYTYSRTLFFICPPSPSHSPSTSHPPHPALSPLPPSGG